MFYVVIKGKYEKSEIPYNTLSEAEEGAARAKRKIAFAHCEISIKERCQ